MDEYHDAPAHHPIYTNRILSRIDRKLEGALWLLGLLAVMLGFAIFLFASKYGF